MFPTRDEAIAILKEHTSSSFEGILKHSLKVEELAVHIASQINCHIDTVSIGSLLHDIGRFKHPPKSIDAIRHGVHGSSILTEIGIDKTIVRIAETHIGAGITINDIKEQNLPLEYRDYTPVSIEEKVVGYADNCVRYDEILDVDYPIERFRLSLGIKHANRVIAIHNELVKSGFNIDLHGKKQLIIEILHE